MRPNYKYITNFVFICSLLLLLLNDMFLKAIYHNGLTGKLSDISGIIVFALFLTAFNSRVKKHIFFATALLFAFWKTEFAHIFIDSWNALNIIQIERTVDYTDILCLGVLFPLYRYSPKAFFSNLNFEKIVAYPITAVTLFAIIGTSQPMMIGESGNYVLVDKYVKLNLSKESFLNQLKLDNIEYIVTDSTLVVKEDTLSKIILKNIIISQDTIYNANIGLHDKGNRLKLYIKDLQIKKNSGHTIISIHAYEKMSKKYRVESVNYIKRFKN